MTFRPIVPASGYLGWTLLQRTLPGQRELYAESSLIKREAQYFKDNIGEIKSASALVADRTLLKVALGAFGLGDDLQSKAFVQKVLEDGTVDDDALSNRLSDKRYSALAEAFGFGKSAVEVPKTNFSGFAGDIVDRYVERSFEVELGEISTSMRLGLEAKRDLAELAKEEDTTERTKWFSLMGSAPLRAFMETTLGIPTVVGALDLDRQVEIFEERAEVYFNDTTVSQFADSETLDRAIRQFILKDEIASTASSLNSSASIALTLLTKPNSNLLLSLYG